MVVVGVAAGLTSLGFQSRMVDVNPQAYCSTTSELKSNNTVSPDCSIAQETKPESPAITGGTEILPETAHHSMLNNSHFLLFLLYFGVWAFGMNLSNPFFNLYLLDNLALDLSWVTLYNGLGAGANLLMLLFWGKLADQIGNRPILLLDGVLVALTPLFWLGTDATSVSIWLWFPLLHLVGGGTIAAIDLCINNLQLAIAPVQHHTKYFAITAAVGGVAGAMGALVGGWLAQSTQAGGMTGLFALSSVLRLVALLPLVWLQEPQRRSLRQTLQRFAQQAQSWFRGTRPEVPTKP
jgi:MFS family permease